MIYICITPEFVLQKKEADDTEGKLKEAKRQLSELEAAEAAEKERLKQIASELDSKSAPHAPDPPPWLKPQRLPNNDACLVLFKQQSFSSYESILLHVVRSLGTCTSGLSLINQGHTGCTGAFGR